MKTLEELLDGVDYKLLQGSLDAAVADIAYDSRKAASDYLFVAIAGTVSDGHKYIPDVIKKGVSAIVVEKDLTDIPDGDKIPDDIAVVKVANGRSALSLISQNYFEHPMKKMITIGVTGTKGKSTTVFLIKNIIEKSGGKCGIIGTIGVAIGDKITPIEHTTPESYDLQKYIYDIAQAGCGYMVMEVSSQGVKMDRVAGMHFDYGMFTNITPDHIGENEHEDFNDYLRCKAALFDMCNVGVFNADDRHTAYIVRGAHCVVKTYGIAGYESAKPDIDDEQFVATSEKYTGKRNLIARDVEHVNETDKLAMSFLLTGLVKSRAEVGLPGVFNVYNALGAITIGTLLGISDEDIIEGIKEIEVRGRVEAVPTGRDFSVLIDFPHNGVSTESVLKTLRGYEPKRLIAIFGCGGNRSKLRRYEMGEAVGRFADYAVVTSDNPRTEKFADIVEDIKVGLAKTDGEYTVIEDRMEAVAYAVNNAKPGDMIVLLGKGHEEYQEIDGVKHHYSEREAVEAALEAL